MKKCRICELLKSYEEFFKRSAAKDGRATNCKSCYSAYYKNYRATNLQDVQRKEAERRAASAVIRNDKQKQYYVEKRSERLAYNKEWREANKSKIRDDKARYQKDNIEKISLRRAAYYLANKEKIKAYRIANPDVGRAVKARRRARKNGSSGAYTRMDVALLLVSQKRRCICCKVDIESRYHVDHIVPLARGGSNDKLNIQLLCPACNQSKNSKDPIEFMQSRGFLL